MRMLLLPTGEVLLSARSNDIRVYQPVGNPHSSWAPQITNSPSVVHPGDTYTLSGSQLNGLSQANSYGDDGTMATNFPIVRIKNLSTNHVFYCRTHGFSTMGVATGATTQSAQFDVPASIEMGASQLCVIANGISACAPVVVNNKIWKELKWEIKEFKEGKWEIKEIEIKHVPDSPKLKDNEGDPWQQYLGDPAWLQSIGTIAERVDQLQEEVQKLRSFIRQEERPNLGEKALQSSTQSKSSN
jgi:hypothetical protein